MTTTEVSEMLAAAKILPSMLVESAGFSKLCKSHLGLAAYDAMIASERRGDAVSAAAANAAALAWLAGEPTARAMIAAKAETIARAASLRKVSSDAIYN